MTNVNGIAKYLECKKVSVILDEEEIYFTKSNYNTHKQCYINQLPLNFDVICIIKDFLYYGSVEIKIDYCKFIINDKIDYMMIHREEKYDIEGNHIYNNVVKRVDNTRTELYICSTCGNYKPNWRNTICPKLRCGCFVPPIYAAHVLDDDREDTDFYPDMGYDPDYEPLSDDEYY